MLNQLVAQKKYQEFLYNKIFINTTELSRNNSDGIFKAVLLVARVKLNKVY